MFLFLQKDSSKHNKQPWYYTKISSIIINLQWTTSLFALKVPNPLADQSASITNPTLIIDESKCKLNETSHFTWKLYVLYRVDRKVLDWFDTKDLVEVRKTNLNIQRLSYFFVQE